LYLFGSTYRPTEAEKSFILVLNSSLKYIISFYLKKYNNLEEKKEKVPIVVETKKRCPASIALQIVKSLHAVTVLLIFF